MIGPVHRVLQKLAALALLAVVVSGVFFVAVEPVIGRLDAAQGQIGEQRKLLGKLNASIGDTAATSRAEILTKSILEAAPYLTGSSDAVRIAQVQSLANSIAGEEGAQITSIRALPGRERGGLRLVGVEAQLTTTIENLQKILYRLENGQPYLLVDSLHIAAPPVVGETAADASALQIRIGLFGIVSKRNG